MAAEISYHPCPGLRWLAGRALDVIVDGPERTIECIIAENTFGYYCVPFSSRHRPACESIMSGDIWEPDTIEFMISNCDAGDIVHAGTFFGDFLPALARGISAGARIWAFEPVRENYLAADITLMINEITNVELTNSALGAKTGTATMSVVEANGRSKGGSSHVLRDDRETSVDITEDVRIVSLDESIPVDRQVSVLQLDLEGYEAEALVGAMATIRRCSPIIILESVPKDGGWFRQNFLEQGYRECGKIHANTVFRRDQAVTH